MRGGFTNKVSNSIPGGAPRGLTQPISNGNGSMDAKSMNLSMRVMKLKLSGKIGQPRAVSPRKQVGETEEMLGGEKPWWRNVGMEEGM
ncbi:uncharacterized protein PV09_07462 [Verruconis gallopava]|uniref:Uncharacterized protein n=1 Tax=Verruconis gallopava TaxID=253628 RepID=A0A0D2A319_9PEZI|nr:uncharacterized protein PV09_07462 [Verruconis gallopava]KIW01178.1 hypothetical protein PV09_07462 [Verruconis gallopava]